MSIEGLSKKERTKAPPAFAKRKTATVSQIHEARVAGRVGGRVQPGSGNKLFAKGDIKVDSHLIECKTTEKMSMSVKSAWLQKITEEARMENRLPAMQISFENMPLGTEKDWLMIPMSQLETE